MRNINFELSGYRKMVLFVMFDLPTETKGNLDKYRKFRKEIMGFGFIMFQYSIYIRYCKSLEVALKYEKKIAKIAPNTGTIRILKVTESQFQNMKTIEKQEKNEDFIEKGRQTIMVF